MNLRRLALAVLLASASGLALAQGAVIAIGGALRFDNDAVWQRIVDEAGGKGARIAVFADGSAHPERAGGLAVEALNRRGARAEFMSAGSAPQRLGDIQGVYIAGGAQDRIAEALAPAGRPSAMLEAIRALQARGGVIAGTSAGAAVMSERMIRDVPDPVKAMQGPIRAGQEWSAGLGFIGADLLIDQHFLRRGRIGRLLPLMQAMGYGQGLGVEENSAVVLRGDALEVIGARGALLVDLREARHEPGAFNLRGAVLSYLDHGDRHDFKTGLTTVAPAKRWEAPGGATEPLFYFDMLGDNTIVHAMNRLMDSGLAELRGLAAGAVGDTGFEFRLHKGPESAAWCSSASGAEECSLLKLRLDVKPVKLQRPLYTPLDTPPTRR